VRARLVGIACALSVSAAAVGVVALGGCSTVLGIQSDRYVVDAGPDSASAANFSCENDPAPTPDPGLLSLELYVNDVSSVSSANNFAGNAVPGAIIHACSKLDVTCANPVSSETANDAGIATLSVPSGFDGYCELTADGSTPAIAARTPILRSEYSLQGIANVKLIAAGGQLAGVQSDPTLGIAIVSILDCDLTPAPGMLLEVGAPGANETLVYLDQTLPSASATETDSTGSAIIYNVPPGTLRLTASFASDHTVLRTMTTLARGGWVTFVQMRLDQSRLAPLQ
jgi:hypothetical protein